MGRWYTWLTRNHTSPNLARRSLAHTLKLTIEVSVHALALALLYGPLWLVAYTQLVEWYTLRVAAGGVGSTRRPLQPHRILLDNHNTQRRGLGLLAGRPEQLLDLKHNYWRGIKRSLQHPPGCTSQSRPHCDDHQREIQIPRLVLEERPDAGSE